MSWNGSEQLEKAMEEVLDDDDEVKVEKSSVEKMEKHSNPETRVLGPGPAGKDSCFRSIYSHCVYMEVVTICLSLPLSKISHSSHPTWQDTRCSLTFPKCYWI